jgi:hypothetical protein
LDRDRDLRTEVRVDRDRDLRTVERDRDPREGGVLAPVLRERDLRNDLRSQLLPGRRDRGDRDREREIGPNPNGGPGREREGRRPRRGGR